MMNIMELNTKALFDYLHLENEINVLFSKLFPNWEFADVVIGDKLPWNCKKSLVNKLMRDGKAEVELTDSDGSYMRVIKVTVNEGFIVNAIFEMESDPWDPESDLDDDYYYHQDISWKRVY